MLDALTETEFRGLIAQYKPNIVAGLLSASGLQTFRVTDSSLNCGRKELKSTRVFLKICITDGLFFVIKGGLKTKAGAPYDNLPNVFVEAAQNPKIGLGGVIHILRSRNPLRRSGNDTRMKIKSELESSLDGAERALLDPVCMKAPALVAYRCDYSDEQVDIILKDVIEKSSNSMYIKYFELKKCTPEFFLGQSLSFKKIKGTYPARHESKDTHANGDYSTAVRANIILEIEIDLPEVAAKNILEDVRAKPCFRINKGVCRVEHAEKV